MEGFLHAVREGDGELVPLEHGGHIRPAHDRGVLGDELGQVDVWLLVHGECVR